ncbi:metallophosphoesterase [Coraliomargarita sp. SDUM461004]|uniref:Metallophosphoesterase n=1 Tax=Thalassobacterium sedimentorum TaxID=3041258 RepID=A0ABU1ADX6_9BACT|nr:metallophosphoesterase [Coraliomargarita sp. SDUM461004]MDQ8192787.1 metallophosphoesterase [Coraliomargarita sp. SDUM461004]
MAEIKLLICSDLHVSNSANETVEVASFVDVLKPNEGPLHDLKDFLYQNNLTCDFLVCPGDLGDAADPDSIRFGWKELADIGGICGASVLATAGNHDLDSERLYDKADCKGVLQGLSPQFPVLEQSLWDQYWARHYCIFKRSGIRFVLLNSCGFHESSGESAYGRLSDKTLNDLKNDLLSESCDINVLVCHHPPQGQSEGKQGDGDYIKNGDELIHILDHGNYGDWLVIYGHKHFAKLQYSRGSANSPILLSSGSASAYPFGDYGKDGKNQIHFVTLLVDDFNENGLLGTIESYEWDKVNGWLPSVAEGGLPDICGFGHRPQIRVLCRQIADAFGESDVFLNLSVLIEKFPMLRYLDPIVRKKLEYNLRHVHGIAYHGAKQRFRKI